VRPGDDFFRYANGTWLKNNPIPASESRWGAFSEVQENNYRALHEILDDAAKRTDSPKGSALQMVGDLYASAMDSARAEADGAKPLDDEMHRIDAIKTVPDLQDEIAHLQMVGQRIPFIMFAAQDAKASTEIVMQLVQGGLGLPDRDYYTKDDDASKKLRDQYVEHVMKMLAISLVAGTAANLAIDGRFTFAAAQTLPAQSWLILLALATICTAIGYSIWFIVIRDCPINVAALTVFAQSVFGVGLAAVWLREPLHWGQLLGCCAIVAGLVLGLSRQLH
jgi:predicted metalloendopeptidase